MRSKADIHTELVLIGSGHAHVQVLKAFGMQPEPGVRLTLIAKEIEAPYSGMLPGFVAGHYTHDQIHIDVLKLARFANARLIHGEVMGIDRETRRIAIAGRPPLAYDLLSMDVGITPELSGIKGAEHAIAVKPVSTFARRWQELLSRAREKSGPRRFVQAGGGAAGLEIVLAMAHRLRTEVARNGGNPDDLTFQLVSGTELLPTHRPRARKLARAALAARRVELIERRTVAEVGEGYCRLDDGRRIDTDAVLLATKAAPAPWFRSSGLACTPDGFLALRPTLQLVGDDDIFAVGDCGTVLEHPRAKAGVFAVRQGPPLTENLRRIARGRDVLPFKPQKEFLTILSLGDQDAIAARGPITVSGPWVWRWKDRIDREFMEKFQVLPQMQPASDEEMRCGGCAAKVGPASLTDALDRLGGAMRGVLGLAARDDAAVVDYGAKDLTAESVDFFRAFWLDPYVFGEIAANHALGDIYAMGGKPRHALAIAMLPHARARLVSEDLYQLLAGARARLDADGVPLVGGHSSEGAELAAGFCVSGTVARGRVLLKGGLREGDLLVLTKPLGTGILLAAEMRGLARATDVFAMMTEMRRSLSRDAAVLTAHGATAMTDVTGFGIGGHLDEMLSASGMAAEVMLDALPLYEGVAELAAAGIASTLLPQNRTIASEIQNNERLEEAQVALLFDPQTAGGLLAGVPSTAASACLRDLHEGGSVRAVVVGRVRAWKAGAKRIHLQPAKRLSAPEPVQPAALLTA